MSASTIGFRSPAAGFDDPLELWLACHRRVERFCALLQRLPPHLATQGADEQAREAAQSIRRYFNEAAPRHHLDEEADLFVRLRERVPAADAAGIAAVLQDLAAEHAAFDGRWRTLDAALAEIAAGRIAPLAAADCTAFAAAYAAHIALEEGPVLDALRRWLTAEDWAALGLAMAARRGARWER